MTNLRTVNLNSTQERTFQIQLKNDSIIEFKFSPITATGDNLWQMFATTEALDTLEQLVRSSDNTNVTETKSARKKMPNKKS
jgi:hypothetical protein